MTYLLKQLWSLCALFLLAIHTADAGASDGNLVQRDFHFATLLTPKDWHVKTQSGGGTSAAFVSKESIEKGGEFRTGLSINAIKEANKRTGLLPTFYAKAKLEQIIRPHQETSSFTEESISGFYATFQSQNPKNESIITFIMTAGNDQSGTAYIVTFESPEESWHEAWSIGAAMIKSLKFNPTY